MLPRQVFQIYDFYTSTESAHHAEQSSLKHSIHVSYGLAELLGFHIRCFRPSIFESQQKMHITLNNYSQGAIFISLIVLLYC